VKKTPNKLESLPERRKMFKNFGSQRFQKTIQLVLIVVLLATTFAFLPQPAVAAEHAALANVNSNGTLTAQLNGRKVTISGTNFNKSREFIANAKSGNGNSTKLGSVKSNSKGAFKTTFNLPVKFKITKNLMVCVRDIKTSKRTCVTIK
jgi:hypothetical protein